MSLRPGRRRWFAQIRSNLLGGKTRAVQRTFNGNGNVGFPFPLIMGRNTEGNDSLFELCHRRLQTLPCRDCIHR
jgi:hypothetical protein